MKKFLAIIILSSYFLTSSQADSIKDFEIEGVSIGDSLLSYVNKSEINTLQKSMEVYQIFITQMEKKER